MDWHVFQEAVLATTSGSSLEHNKFVGQISILIRVLTSKDGDLLSQFDNIIEGNTDADFDSTSLKKSSLIIIISLARNLIREKLKVNHH